MRRLPPPLSVTSPRPSSTTRRLVLTTLAVWRSSIRTGRGPQRNRMIPPLATARTTARDVQVPGVPWPTQRSGWEVSTARAARGTGTAADAAAGRASAAPAARHNRALTVMRQVAVDHHARPERAGHQLVAAVRLRH